MQHLDPRPFDKPQFDQPALELGSRQPVIASANLDSPDPALVPDWSCAERLRIPRRLRWPAMRGAASMLSDPKFTRWYCDSLSFANTLAVSVHSR